MDRTFGLQITSDEMKQFYWNIKHELTVFVLLFLFCSIAIANAMEFDIALMESTFKLKGEGSRGNTVSGTAFIIGRSTPKNPKKCYPVLITAAHVLNRMQGDQAHLILRKKKKDETWERIPYPIKIRENGKPLWVCHKDVDVAAMDVIIPPELIMNGSILSDNFLADDMTFEKYEIRPGDEVMCLGYPLGKEKGPFGFPVLQSGKVASYPLLPRKHIKTFICDLKISQGYSGGPVYFYNKGRSYGGSVHFEDNFHSILGLITKIPLTQEELDRLYEEEKRFYFGFARAVHAGFIKETIDKLPKRE